MIKCLLSSNLNFLAHERLDNINQQWKYLSVWISMGLAVRDCSVSFGGEIISPLFSYWYIKQYTYIRSDSFNISASWFFLETKSDNELEWCALVALFTAIQYKSHLFSCLQTSMVIQASLVLPPTYVILASYWSIIEQSAPEISKKTVQPSVRLFLLGNLEWQQRYQY